MKTRAITLHIILITALATFCTHAIAQHSIDPTAPELEKLIVFIRDAKDSTLLRKDVKVEPRMFTPEGKRDGVVITGTTDDGVIIIGLGGGSYELAFEAEGYHSLLVTDCAVRSTSAYGQLITFAHNELSFRGEVFTYTVYLASTEGRRSEWRYQPFLAETTYFKCHKHCRNCWEGSAH